MVPLKPFNLKFQADRPMPDIGLQGLPQLRSNEIIRPTPFNLVESATIFTEIEVANRAIRLWVPGQRRVLRAVPHRLHDSPANIISNGEFIPSVNGVLDLFAPGLWYINTPIVTAEGTQVNAKFSDAAFAVAALSEAESEDPNSFTALFQPRVMAAPTTNADVDNADENLVAAQVGRRYLYIRNTSTGAQTIWLAFGGATAVVGSGIGLAPGEWISFDALDGCTEQEVRVISDAANATVAMQTGT